MEVTVNGVDNSTRSEELLKQHARAKKQTNRGFALLIIGFIIIELGLALIWMYGLGLIIMIPGIQA